MNVIIIYSSKYGCTADCASYLKSVLSGSVTLTNIDNTNLSEIALEHYDTVILGSPIYIGMISKKIKKLCNENIDVLSKKKLGIFLCCAFPDEAEKYLTKNFPKTLLQNAVTRTDFGGEARIDKMKYMDKLIMKAAIKDNHDTLKISYKNMDNMISQL